MAAAGGFHSLYLNEAGEIKAWGDNSKGQLGIGTTKSTNTPTELTIETKFDTITAGASHSLAIDAVGNVYAWGDNSKGQLGTSTATVITPAKIDNLAKITAVDAGKEHSLALDEDGNIWVWGSNGDGQLGTTTASTTSSNPLKLEVKDGDTVVTFSTIAAGGAHSVALSLDGSIWTWGSNKVGQLGNGTTDDGSKPVKLDDVKDRGDDVAFTAIAAGRSHTLALDDKDNVWAWGEGKSGQLGQGNTANKKSPAKIKGIENVTMITAGDDHNIALVKDGKIWSWGKNNDGQLGLNSPFSYIKPQEIKGLRDVEYISAGGSHSLALTEVGEVYGWGSNNKGQLGTGDKNKFKPEEIDIGGTTGTCVPSKMKADRSVISIKKGKSKDVIITLSGENGCKPEGEKVKAEVTDGTSFITLNQTETETDGDGNATFQITANNAGRAKVQFSNDKLDQQIEVKINIKQK